MLLMTTISAMAQMKLNFGDDSPLRKLQIAELAISNLSCCRHRPRCELRSGLIKLNHEAQG